MALLWTERTTSEVDYTSPQWYQDELQQTQQRLAEGKEKIQEWDKAKQMLRNEFK